MNNPEVKRNATTPIKAPVITRISWSLIATAAATLSTEKAKSVRANATIVLMKEIDEECPGDPVEVWETDGLDQI